MSIRHARYAFFDPLVGPGVSALDYERERIDFAHTAAEVEKFQRGTEPVRGAGVDPFELQHAAEPTFAHFRRNRVGGVIEQAGVVHHIKGIVPFEQLRYSRRALTMPRSFLIRFNNPAGISDRMSHRQFLISSGDDLLLPTYSLIQMPCHIGWH